MNPISFTAVKKQNLTAGSIVRDTQKKETFMVKEWQQLGHQLTINSDPSKTYTVERDPAQADKDVFDRDEIIQDLDMVWGITPGRVLRGAVNLLENTAGAIREWSLQQDIKHTEKQMEKRDKK